MQNTNYVISKSVFVISFSIVFFSLVSVVFPSLIIRLTSGISASTINQWEFGLFAIPIIVVNSIFFVIYFLYQRKLLPNSVYKSTNFLLDFDIPKKISLVILLAMLAIYVGLSFQELFLEETLPDRPNVIRDLDNWGIKEDLASTISFTHTKLFFLSASEFLFGNMRVLPFFVSISLLVLTYFFAYQISSKRLSGNISVAVILQSSLFLEYDTVITYANFWVTFYLFSLYLVKKAWPFSALSFVASFFAKPLTLAYFPLNLFYICRTEEPLKKKILTLIPYLVMFIALIIVILLIPSSTSLLASDFVTHPSKFFSGFTIFPYQLRFDLFVMMLLLPVSFLLYQKAQKGHKYSQSIQIIIAGIIFTGPVLTGFLNYQLNPYRLVPLVVFFAIGFGLLFSKNIIRDPYLRN